MHQYDLIEIGRSKYSGRISVNDDIGLYRELKKHLVSRNVDIVWNDHQNYGVVTAGFYTVGHIRRVDSDNN
jgi:hypothetical protein